MHNTSDLVANELQQQKTHQMPGNAAVHMCSPELEHGRLENNAYNINLQSKTREYQKTKTQTSLI